MGFYILQDKRSHIMNIFTKWGFTREGWRNNSRGEYWVLVQGALIVGLIILPVYRPTWLNLPSSEWLYFTWGIAALLAITGLVIFLKGLLDLGQQLTPLPYPIEEGQLVQSGIYSLVRHPVYSGVILAAFSWTIFQLSLSHLMASAILFAFFDAKANREETWLSEKYPDYSDYRQRVKKLIPWLY